MRPVRPAIRLATTVFVVMLFLPLVSEMMRRLGASYDPSVLP